MADKRRLVDDPNTPYDDTKLLQSPRMSVAAARQFALTGDPGQTASVQRQTGEPEPMLGGGGGGAPKVRRPDPALDEARQYGASAGRAAAGYLGERKALAPGVRRWGSKTADPAEVYMTVDKGGNRVYTDDADFAAGQSRGRLTRRDLAPGMLRADADRTLNDPEGGYTYAAAPGKGLDGLREASGKTRGGSKTIERALAEAERSQAIVDTRAGERPIDERRRTDGQRLRRSLGMEGGDLDPRTLIALQRLGLDERKFAAERADKDADRTASGSKDALSSAQGVAGLLTSAQKGEIDATTARDLLATLPGEAGARGARGLRQALLRKYLLDQDPFFLGEEEAGLADLSDVRLNPDGSGTYVEPDSGFFDIGREIDIPMELRSEIYGAPEDVEATRDSELRRRVGRRGL